MSCDQGKAPVHRCSPQSFGPKNTSFKCRHYFAPLGDNRTGGVPTVLTNRNLVRGGIFWLFFFRLIRPSKNDPFRWSGQRTMFMGSDDHWSLFCWPQPANCTRHPVRGVGPFIICLFPFPNAGFSSISPCDTRNGAGMRVKIQEKERICGV